MRLFRPTLCRPNRGPVVGLAVLACAISVGCAAPLGQRWADRSTRRQIEQVMADGSFPTAAEAGLAATDETAAAGS